MNLSIVIPTYNEAENLPILINRIFNVFQDNSLDGEVMIVDDDSPDKTWQIAEQLKQKYNIELLRRLNKRGLSSAVLDGFLIAKGEILGVMDADLSHAPEKIPDLINPILSGDSDFVIGSRNIEGGDSDNWPFLRKLSSKLATIAARGLTNIKDPMSGYFFIKKEVIDGTELSPMGFKICLEILVKGKYKKATEVPILFSNREFGKSKLNSTVIFHYISHLSKLYLYNLFH